MKKIAYLIFLLCFPTIIIAQWVTDNNYGFKIQIPSNWTQESKVVGTDKVYDFLDPTQNIFIEIRAFKADGNTTADNISQVFESQYLSTAQRVAFDNYTLNNTPGKFAGYTMTVDGLNVGIAAFYAVKNGNGYVIWSMIETKHYDQYSGQGDNVMNTFTSFASTSTSSRVRTVAIPPSFKITNMKLGAKLTSDYDILPQDVSTNFMSDDDKIYVIWDWEGSAAGKTMSIHWYKNGQEMTTARKNYTLPSDKQGYGYANIVKPADGFGEGNYYVQINFENTKQRSINFQVKKTKAATNQGSGFVIKPPSGNGGKGLNPNNNANNNSSNNTNSNSSNNTNTSSFIIDVNSVKIGSELRSGTKAELKNPTDKFYKNTLEVIVVFDWIGNGQGQKLTVNWDYYKSGSNNKTRIISDNYNFPNQNGGESNFALTKPNNGWPLGQYWIEFYLGDQFVYEWRFDVIDGAAPNSGGGNSTSSSTDWGKATGGSSAATSGSSSSSTSSSGKVKTIVLTSGTNQSCFSFKTGKSHKDHNNADIMIEPWCTEEAGVCGNWVETSQTSLAALKSPPASGYISDLAGYTDCQLMPKNKVIVVKLADGTYAKMIIVNTVFSKIQNSDWPCQHKTTIKYQYPF